MMVNFLFVIPNLIIFPERGGAITKMLFDFIKYTQPGWQFNLVPKVDGCFASCYPPVNLVQVGNVTIRVPGWGCAQSSLSEAVFYDEQTDDGFETESARIAEFGYRLWNKGYLLESTNGEIKAFDAMPKPSLRDEYRFVRKYWGGGWAIYAYLLRLFSLHNVVKETRAFIETRDVRRINAFQHPKVYEDYENFDAPLLRAKPLVAVIIPTLNRYPYLKDVLHDLEAQDYSNVEVIVVDQSDAYDEAFYQQFKLRLTLFRQEEKLLWTARNKAALSTASAFLLFFDDDSRVAPNWVSEHLKCLDYFKADISAGVSLATVGQKIPASYGYFRWADQFDSGNAMVKRCVFEKTGYFDELFNGQRMGDAEFGIRAYLNGFRSISNPNASRVHLKVSSGGLRDMGHWDAFRPKKWFAPKPVPSVTYLYKKYYPPALWKNAILTGIILSNVPYRFKRYKQMLLLSLCLSVIKSPILYIQYRRSLHIAGKMLERDKESHGQ